MNELEKALKDGLDQLAEEGLTRTLEPGAGLDFTSNDYLGLSMSPAFSEGIARLMEDQPLSAPASRLLRGTHPAHLELEKKLAEFKGTEAALIFPTGYQANIGLLSALMGPQDRVLSDELNHASIIDGLRLSGAQKCIVPHLDLSRIEEELSRPHPGGKTFLLSESYFSMDGDIAPLGDYAALAEKYSAALVIDDAHATGLFGDQRGSGLAEEFGIESRCAAIVSTFGKALGSFGSFVAGSRVLIDWLINRSRAFIFSTATPPLLLAMMEAGVDLCSDPGARTRLHALSQRLRNTLAAGGIDCSASRGPIVPVIIGSNEAALEAASKLQAEGFDVRAIRPPTVAPGSSRLRISVHADHCEDDIDRLGAAVLRILTQEKTG
jgi:8-amino-7-oxononanoate synthase